jgi:hypothetical protein
MNVYRAKELDITGTPRAHPWTTASHDASCRYIDFRREPEKITTSLENFLQWGKYPAIQQFYDFLRWVNGPDSILESNDCAFSFGPNDDTNHHFQFVASGRVMLFVADLRFTCLPRFGECLMDAFGVRLQQCLPPSPPATVGLSQSTSFFKELRRRGKQVVLYFWAWGDSEESTFCTLAELFDRMLHAAKDVSRDIQVAMFALDHKRCESSAGNS